MLVITVIQQYTAVTDFLVSRRGKVVLFDTSQMSEYDVFFKLLGAEETFEFDGLANEHQYIDSMY